MSTLTDVVLIPIRPKKRVKDGFIRNHDRNVKFYGVIFR